MSPRADRAWSVCLQDSTLLVAWHSVPGRAGAGSDIATRSRGKLANSETWFICGAASICNLFVQGNGSLIFLRKLIMLILQYGLPVLLGYIYQSKLSFDLTNQDITVRSVQECETEPDTENSRPPGMVVHTFTLGTREVEAGRVSEFETRLVYKGNSKTARADSKNQPNTKKTCSQLL